MKKLFITILLINSFVPLAAAKKKRWKKDGEFKWALKEHDLPRIGPLLDAGADFNEYFDILDASLHCPLYEALRDRNPASVAVVALLVKKGADLGYSKALGRNWFQLALFSTGSNRKEKLLILLDNGVGIDFDEASECFEHRLHLYGTDPDSKKKEKEEQEELLQVIIDEAKKRAQKRLALLAEVQNFLPVTDLADMVSEYRGYLDIKTEQELQQERQLAEQQQQEEQKESEQKEQLQQKPKLAGEIIWV
jgi:hypothetical protein